VIAVLFSAPVAVFFESCSKREAPLLDPIDALCYD
jgi:hypothetical protein